MFHLLLTVALALPIKPVKVAVIDTGFDTKSKWTLVNPSICKTIDITSNKNEVNDTDGHGTHVSGLVALYARESSYCINVYKIFRDGHVTTQLDTSKAVYSAIKDGVDIINLSLGGVKYSKEECDAIDKAIENGIVVVAAAGNNGVDLKKYNYYPAKCNPKIIIVGNIDENKNIVPSSNYSTSRYMKIVFDNGYRRLSILPDNRLGYRTGTSQATAVVTGKLVRDLWNKRVDFYK